FDSMLTELQKTSANDAEDLYLLLVWMNEHGLALAVPELAAHLPAETLSVPQIRAALADAEARASNWTVLRDRIEKEQWKDIDFLPLAFLARALERLGDATGASAAWSNALASIQGKPHSLELLGKTVRDWGWNKRAEEVFWKLAPGGTCPRWVADYLWSAAL